MLNKVNAIKRLRTPGLCLALAGLVLLFGVALILIAQDTPPAGSNTGKDTPKKGGTGKKNGSAGKKKGPAGPKAGDAPANPPPTTDNAPATDPSAGGKDGKSAQGDPTVCRAVKLGRVGVASEYKSELDKAGGVAINVAGKHELVLCGPPANVDVLEAVVQGLSAYAVEDHGNPTHVVRLFYSRQADKIAEAINQSGGLGTPVKALGNDVLVFTSESGADDAAIRELKRWIALIDVPRPEVSLSAWSIQISSKDLKAILVESAKVRGFVAIFNERLHSALQQGWRYLETETERTSPARQGPFLDPLFTKYLTKRFLWQEYSPDPSSHSTSILKPQCPADEYCLGYSRMFSPIQPSLTNMLIALAATRNSGDAVNNFVNCLESRPDCEKFLTFSSKASESYRKKGSAIQGLTEGKPDQSERAQPKPDQSSLDVFRSLYPGTRDIPDHCPRTYETPSDGEAPCTEKYQLPPNDCEQEDQRWLSAYGDLGPAFSCFRRQLQESLRDPGSKALLRVALADFLFHYKAAELYPHDFVAYNRGASAQKLDNLFNPLLVEFNRDLGIYLESLNTKITSDSTHNKNINYRSEGMIRVSVLSGTQAKVSTTTQSFFPQPPVISARDFLSAMPGGGNSGGKGAGGKSPAGKSGGDNSGGSGDGGGATKDAASAIPSLLSSNLAPVPAAALLALVQSAKNNTAQIGRDLNLTITANTLSGASSAELDVELDSGEHDQPQLLDQDNKSSNDNVDRVAVHNTTTRVRVDSLKLFEISAFSATLTHGRSVPLIPPFIELPYLGNLARLRLPPGTVYHRSFAIVTAVVVPTAADIANAIEFRSDLEEKTLPKANLFDTNQDDAATGKAKDKTAGEAATTIQVQQTSGANTPLSLQLGCGSCSTGKSGSPKKEPNGVTPPSTTTQKHYYSIVTHYHEGISVAGPFEVSVVSETPAKPGKQSDAKGKPLPLEADAPVMIPLAWEAPREALAFDLYWSDKKRGQLFLIAANLRTRYYEDDVSVAEKEQQKVYARPEDTIIYSQLPAQPRNLLEFHNLTLTCLELEAEAEPKESQKMIETGCKNGPLLSTTPVTRPR